MSRKLALIIGNNDYSSKPLTNCVNDATHLADILRSVENCEVKLKTNLKSEDMYECIKDFISSIEQNDFIIFFFAGHGVQWGDQNFLLPCDNNKITSGEDMQRYAINAQSTVNKMAEMYPHIVLFLLDCCRNYWMPVKTSNNRALDQQVGGLNQMKAPRQTLMAFACAAGEVVSDQSKASNNGLFTKYLLKHIATPGVHIETILLRVARDVVTESNDLQRPLRVSSLISEEIYLVSKDASKYESLSPPRRTNDRTAISSKILSQFINASEKSSTNDIIRRLAIDQSAVVGSLYDARQDRFLKEPPLQILSKVRPLQETPRCTIININEHSDENLFSLIGIDKDFGLSVKLNMASEGELSSLIKYPLTTNALTQILCYYYSSEEKYMSDRQDTLKLSFPETVQNAIPTHFVTEIKTGMLVVIVLERSPDYEFHLDSILKKIVKQLTENPIKLTVSEERLLDQFAATKIFSNLPELCKLKKLADIYQKITEIKLNMSEHPLLDYTLRPISSLVSLNSPEKYQYFPLTPQIINTIEQYLIPLPGTIKSLKTSFSSLMRKSAENLFEERFTEVQQQISDTQKVYDSSVNQIRSMVYEMRSGASQEETIAEMQIDKYEKLLQSKIAVVNDSLTILQDKLQFIETFTKGIVYWNVKQIVGSNDQDLEAIRKQLLKKGDRKHIYCFDDKLEKRLSSVWKEFYRKLISESERNPQLEFVYADFSFCSCQLQQMEILLSKDNRTTQNGLSGKESSKAIPLPSKPTPSPSKSTSSASKSTPPPAKPIPSSSAPAPSILKIPCPDEPNSSAVNFINILLLGESNVGKSTFINAIVNYLNFGNLTEACSGEPIMLIPVSFLMTVGDQFEERIVRFGDKDPNEDHNHPGQSVTQRCRSYVFAIGTQTKIRLIDTPGMGDTRGLDQDDLNMQHILSFINNLPHLNAICILLKPNESRLNVVFRSYFTRLLGFLGENIRNNVIFCFTNTRATFFAPGNTGPLLKKMLSLQSVENIPCTKKNTFCFDNESFRYLVARLNEIDFDDNQKEEYERSWVTSVGESKRLLHYFCDEPKPYPQENWQSTEHAQFQITQLIRPMLETIRNTMRNVILLDKNLSRSLIRLQPTFVPGNAGVCLDCKRPEFLCEFWIIPDIRHVLSNRCEICPCDFSRHSKVDYLLTYGSWVETKQPSFNEMKANLDRLKQMIIEFVYSFKDVVRISKGNDPILSALNRMIDEEKDIYSQKGQNGLNSYLYNELKNFRREYENIWTTSTANRKSTTLIEIYDQIETVSKNPMISKQLDATKQTQEIYMNEHEKQIS